MTTAAKSSKGPDHDTHTDSSAGSNGIALAPPAYGIDMVDRAPIGEGPLQLMPKVGQMRGPGLLGGKGRAISASAPSSPPNNNGLSDYLKAGIESPSRFDMSVVQPKHASTKAGLTGASADRQEDKWLGANGARVQMKLSVGASNDPLEQEADRVAEQVLETPARRVISGGPPHIQRFTGQATGQTDMPPASVDQALASPGKPLAPVPQQDTEDEAREANANRSPKQLPLDDSKDDGKQATSDANEQRVQTSVAQIGDQAVQDLAAKLPADGKVGDAAQDGAPKSVEDILTDKLALIDEELAEHQRWGQATATVGTAESAERAQFIAKAASEGAEGGLKEGFVQGAKMGVGMKVAEKVLEKGLAKGAGMFAVRVGTQAGKFTPVPGVGAAIGGALAAYDLASRDWKATGEAIGRFGQGASIYDQLANSIEAVSNVLEVSTQVLNVIAGVLGAITVVMWVLSIVTAGAMSPIAGTLTAISILITIGTLALDAINAVVLKQLITMFRALHTFTSDADPRDVLMQGKAISQAAGGASGFVGGLAGGLAGGAATEKGLNFAKGKPKPPVPEHPTPPAASGEGPTVKAEPSAQGGTLVSSAKEPSKGMVSASEPGKQTTSFGQPLPSLPEEGHIVWAAMEQLGEKFEMGAGVTPGERINSQRRATTLQSKFEKDMAAAGFQKVQKGKEVSRFEWEPIEGKANQKKADTAKNRYEKKLGTLHDERANANEEAWKGFWKEEGNSNPIDLETWEAAWDKQFGNIGEGSPVSSIEPHRILPLKEPPKVKTVKKDPIQSRLVGRHEHQPPRGESFLISEHIMPGAQWEAVTTGKKGPIYDANQYGYDITMLFPEDAAGIKTHKGATADNRRTEAIKNKIARGERVDIVEDLFLPSIDETIKAKNLAQQQREVRGLANSASPKREMPISQLPAAGRAGQEAGQKTSEGFGKGRQEPVVERVNPQYPPPPGHPNDIVAMQNKILKTLEARAQAESIGTAMAKQETHHKNNEKPIGDMQKGTDEAISATKAHQDAVDRRKQANDQKNDQEGQVKSKFDDYSDKAAKLVTLTGPMRTFQGLVSIAYTLPDTLPPSIADTIPFKDAAERGLKSGKGNLIKMHKDTTKFLDQLDSVDKTIKDQKASQPKRDEHTQDNAKTLDDTKAKANDSNQEFDKAKQRTTDLDQKNADRLGEAKQLHKEADQVTAKLDGQAKQKEIQVQSLAGAMQSWADAHKQARLDALEQTKTKYEQMGYRIVEVREK